MIKSWRNSDISIVHSLRSAQVSVDHGSLSPAPFVPASGLVLSMITDPKTKLTKRVEHSNLPTYQGLNLLITISYTQNVSQYSRPEGDHEVCFQAIIVRLPLPQTTSGVELTAPLASQQLFARRPLPDYQGGHMPRNLVSRHT